jgi:succinate dehydrogenase/fumarate reductase cytochrome b subunit
MSLFTTLHLANVSLIPATMGSVDASETFLLMTREIYQTSIAEPLLVALPFVAHVGSGVALRLIRRRQNIERYGRATPSPWPTMSWISVSGYAFTVFYSTHVFMNRILPLAVEGDSSNIGLGYVAHGFAQHPWISRLAYAGLISIGAGHMIWGAARWMGVSPSTNGWLEPRGKAKAREALVDKKTRRERRRRWMGVHAVAIATATLWAVGGLGVVARGGASGGWVGSIYDRLYAKVGL